MSSSAQTMVMTQSRTFVSTRPSLSDRADMLKRPAALKAPVRATQVVARAVLRPRSSPRGLMMGLSMFQVAL